MLESKCAATKTVLTFGLAASQRGTSLFQLRHALRRLAGSSFAVARVYGQPERVIDTPCHFAVWETISSAARQCAAWLSPMSATVLCASGAGTPNSHGMTSPTCLSGVHGRLGVMTAVSGVGTTARASLGLRHGLSASR